MLLFKVPGIILLYALASVGLGGLILSLSFFKKNRKIFKTHLRFLLVAYLSGQGVFALIWMLLAATGLFQPNLIFGIILASFSLALLLFWKRLIYTIQELLHQIRESFSFGPAWTIIGFASLIFFLFTITSFGRPLSGDAAQLYFPWAKIISASHRLVIVPGQTSGSLVGLFSELNHAVMMSLGVRDAGRMNDVLAVAITALLLLHIGVNLGIRRHGRWVILACLLSTSAFIWLAGKGTADIYACMLALAAFFMLLPEEDDFDYSSYLLAGFFGGMAFYAKISYLIGFFPAMAAIILLRILTNIKPFTFTTLWKGKAIFAGLVFGIGIIAGFSPLLIKNGVLFGDPLIVFSGWGNTYYDPNFHDELIPQIIRAFPWSLFLGNFPYQSGRISILVLAFLPLAILTPMIFKRFRPNLLLQVTIAALFGAVVWMVIRPSVFILRYFLATPMLLFFLPAYAVEKIPQNQKTRFIEMIVIVVMITVFANELYTNIGAFFYPKETVQYLAGDLPECEKDGWKCISLKVLNREANPGDRILFADWYGYWLRPDLIQCMVSEKDDQVFQLTTHWAYLPDFLPGAGNRQQRLEVNDLWPEIFRRGFKYLVLYKEPNAAAGKLKFERMSETPWVHLNELYNDGKIEVYRMDYSDNPYQVEASCVEVQPGLWEVQER